ncbi:MAG: ABC transporter ATP-binding protein [Chloroflexi bacterium]|nr:ABC transporter ATP-binding protein [Chloroflexota bacterium]
MTALVQIEDLRVYFQARKGLLGSIPVKALDGVSLTLEKGETLAVVGESGSGKTTLGRATLRLIRPTGGRLYFEGQEVGNLPDSKLKEFRRKAQGVFQDPYSSMDPFMSIGQVLEEPLAIHGVGNGRERTDMIYQALEDVNLSPPEEVAAKYPHMLSGGQRQRVGLARALILRPDFIVADEPVSMIDASSRAEILDLMRDLQKRFGITFLYITHDIATARHFSDRIAVMYAGRIVELGPADRVIEEPMHPYTVALIRAIPEPDPANRLRQRPVVPGEPPRPTEPPPGCRFHPRCPQAIAGICEAIDPPLIQVRPQHYVACHLWPEAWGDHLWPLEYGH